VDADLERAKQDAEYGPFFAAVDQAFTSLLSGYGYEVREVFPHFQGTYVAYSRGPCSVTIEIEPQSRDVRAVVKFRQGANSPSELISQNVWDILAERDPTTDWSAWPKQRGLNDAEIASLLGRWADGLRRVAPDLLSSCA
jgi:hypothetical protein